MIQLSKKEVEMFTTSVGSDLTSYFFDFCSIAFRQETAKKVIIDGDLVKVPKGHLVLENNTTNKLQTQYLQKAGLVMKRKPTDDGDYILVEVKPITRLIEKADPELKDKYDEFIEKLTVIWGKKVKPCKASEISFAKRYKEHGIEKLLHAAKVAITLFPHNENGGKYLTAEFILRPTKLNRFIGQVIEEKPLPPTNLYSPSR